MTYTVTNRDGDIIGRGLSATRAMVEILTYDGHEFEVRSAPEDGFTLWTSTWSRNSPMGAMLTKSVISSLDEYEDAAIEEIARKVVANAEWFCGCSATTDEAYDAMLAEMAEGE
jgi:hypothetical protein